MLLWLSACEPGNYIIVENNLESDVTIHVVDPVGSRDFGSVGAHSTGRTTLRLTYWGAEYRPLVQIADGFGNIVFSKNITYDEMKRMDWTIVIPSTQGP